MSPRLSELKRHAPSPGTCTRVPVKTSAVRGAAAAVFWFVSREFGGVRDLTAPVVVGVSAALRLIFSVVLTTRGDVAVLRDSAACDAAVAVAGVLTTVFFAQNARELAESLVLVYWAVCLAVSPGVSDLPTA